jgi:hypothetical protein
MVHDYEITLSRYDAGGRLVWRTIRSVDDALLAVMRFARQNPHSICTIELRQTSGSETTKQMDDPV